MFRRRGAGLLVIALAAAAVFTGTSADGASDRAWPRLSVPLDTAHSLSFSYPPRWNALGSTLATRFVTTQFALLAFVGNVPLHRPCREVSGPCNPEAVDSLSPGHVYARWSSVGYAPSRPTSGTTSVTVGGRGGWMLVNRQGWCRRYGTARTLLVFLPAATDSGALEFDACLRPPGLKAEQATALKILRSTAFRTSQ